MIKAPKSLEVAGYMASHEIPLQISGYLCSRIKKIKKNSYIYIRKKNNHNHTAMNVHIHLKSRTNSDSPEIERTQIGKKQTTRKEIQRPETRQKPRQLPGQM